MKDLAWNLLNVLKVPYAISSTVCKESKPDAIRGKPMSLEDGFATETGTCAETHGLSEGASAVTNQDNAETTDAPRSTPMGQRSASAWAPELFQIQMQRNGDAIQIAHSVVQRRTGASVVSETGLTKDRRLIPNLVQT